MKKIALIVASSCLFALSACGTTSSSGESAMGGANAEVEKLIKEAEAAVDKAASVDGEWRDSKKKYIADAKAALAKGDIETAKKLAETAKFQGEMGYQQAIAQKDAKPWLF